MDLGVGDAVRRVGMLRVAVSEEEAQHVREYAQALAEDGFPAELVERGDLPPALRHGGLVACLTEHDGALHPARWYRALAAAAEAAGARIFENTSVQAPVDAPGDGPVLTDAGSVRARHVVVAADGSLPVLGARVRGPRAPAPAPHGRHPARRAGVRHARVRPLGLRVPPAAARRPHPCGRVQRRGRRRLLHRQRRRQPDDLGAHRAATWRDELGSEAEITHRWAGVVGYSEDSLPYVGRGARAATGLFVSGGYSGVGNVPGFMCGRDIADTIAGEPPEPLFPPGR